MSLLPLKFNSTSPLLAGKSSWLILVNPSFFTLERTKTCSLPSQGWLHGKVLSFSVLRTGRPTVPRGLGNVGMSVTRYICHGNVPWKIITQTSRSFALRWRPEGREGVWTLAGRGVMNWDIKADLYLKANSSSEYKTRENRASNLSGFKFAKWNNKFVDNKYKWKNRDHFNSYRIVYNCNNIYFFLFQLQHKQTVIINSYGLSVVLGCSHI